MSNPTNIATFYQAPGGCAQAVQPMFTEAQAPGAQYVVWSPAIAINTQLDVLVFGSAL